MPKYTQELQYNIKTTFDKSGIAQLQSQLKALESTLKTSSGSSGVNIYSDKKAQQDLKNIQAVSNALTKAYSSQTGLLNVGKFTSTLQKSNVSIQQFAASCSSMGIAGQQAFNSLMGQTLSLQSGLKQTTTLAEKMKTTFSNTLRWGIASGAFQEITSTLQSAVSYVQRLDESLTQITMVSGESRDNMKEFASYANKAAASLAASTTTYTNAVKVFIQEGFSLEQSKQQATQAVTLANVSEQDSATTADQITAYRNAFGLSINDMNTTLDKIANLANNTASNVGELMVASQRSASTASSVGASQESFLAAIATIESVTRDSAENIGNGLKSIYTRFADIKMGNSTDDDVNLATYSKALKSAGVNIVDSEGQYKGFDQIFTELQAQWQNLSQTQKLAVGETVAGRYQYNRFVALMNNQDYYEKAYAATQNADGAMEAMQKAYEEGLEAQLQKMSTNMETLFTSIYNTGIVENVVGVLTDFTDVLSGLFDNIDNSLPIISAFVGLIAKLGGTQFAQSVTNAMVNRDTSKNTAIAKAETAKLGNQFAASDLADEDIQRFITSSTAINTNRKLYSEEEIAASTDLQNTFVESRNKRIQLVKEQAEKERKLFELLNDVDKVPDEVFTEEQRLTLGKFQRQIDAGINPDFGTSMSDMLSSVAEKAYGAEAIQKAQKMGNKDASRVQALIDKLTGYQSRYGNESDNPNAAMLKRSVTNLRSGRKGYGYEAIIAPTEAKDVLKQFTDNAKNLRGEEYENAFKEMIVSLTQVRAGFEETQVMSKTAMRNMSSDAQLAVGAIQNLETAEIQANEALKQMQEIGSLRAKISAFTEAVGNVSIAIMGISTAVEGVKQAWDTFSDSEATVQEKSEALLEVFIQMTMTLGSLGPLLGQVFTDAKQLEAEQEVQRTQENLQKAQQEVETALGGKEIAESAGKNATKAAGEEAAEIAIEGVDDLADAVKDNTLAARDGEVATKALTVATEGAAAAEKATAGADAIDTATDIGDIAGDVIGGGKGASKSKGVLGRLFGGNGIKAAGSVLSRLAIPAAAVGLGYFATTKVDELTSSNSTKAQGLSDDTTTLKTAATSVEEEASDLANSFTTLTSNQETLKSLTQGTSEWRDQIKEINSEVSELLEKYPQLAEYVTNTNGVMSISQEGMDKYTEETESRALSASNVAAIMAKNSKTASLEADTEEMIKDSIWGGLGGRVAATAAAGAAGGAWAGGIPGAAIGGGVGAAAGALEYLWEFNDKTAEYTSQIENLADEFNSGSTDMTQWTQQVSDLSHTMGVSQAELTELIQGLAENSAALEENTTSLQTQYGAVDANAGEISWIGEQFNEDNWNEFDSGKSYNSDFIKQFVADTYGNGDTTNVSKIFEEDGEIKASMVGSSEAVTVASSVDNLRAMINAATGEEILREVSDKSKEYLDAASVLGKDGVKPEITADSIIDQVLSSYGMADDIINNGTKESIIALSDYSNELSTHYSELNATGDQALNATTSLEDLTNALDMTTASLDFFQEKIKENYDKTADDKSLDPNDEIIAGSDLEKQKAQALVDNAEAQAIATDKQRRVDDIYTNLRDNRGLTDQGQGLLDSAANKLSEGLTVNDLEGGELTAYSSFEDTIGELVELKKAQAEANKTFEETQETVNRTTGALEEYDNSIERITQSALDSKQGFKNLASTMKSYYDILSKKAKGEDVSASDYADAMGKTQEYLKQAMQISSEDLEDMGGERFILDNLDNIKAAAGGSETALHALQTAAVKALTSSKSALKAFGSDTKTLQSDFMNLASYLQGLDLDVGGTLSMDASPAKAALGNLTSMTVKQAQIMQQVLSGIGFEGQFEYTVGGKAYTSLTEAQKALSELTANDTAGIGYTITAKLKNVKNTSSAKDLSTNDTGDSGGSSGGGGSKASKTKNSIDLDPYQEVNAQLQRQQKILDKLNASYDRLYGKARIKNIQKQLTAERKYMTLLQKEAAIANAQLKQNTKLKRDPETGDKTIKNYIGSGKGKRKNLINSDGSINQKAYEAIARELFKKKGKNTKYENFISAVEAYNSDYEKVQEMLSTIDDAYAEYFETLLKQQDYVQELRKRTDDLNESYYNLKNTIASTVDDLVSDVVSAHNKITTSANDVDLANRQKATADANLADLENQNDLLDSTKVKYNKKSYTLRQLMTKYNNATNAKTKGQLASLIEKTAKANGFAYSNLDDLNSAWVEALQDQGDKAEDVLKAYSSKVESILDAINSVWDAWDDRAEQFENIASRYSTIGDINTIINDEENYGSQIEYVQKSLDATQQSMNFYMQEYERQKQQKELYEQQLAKATTEQERQILEQQIAEQIEKMGDTQDNILDKASATQEDVKTLRDLQIDQAMKSLMGDAFGITSWTTTKLKWEMNKENAEDFYDKYESTYQKSALKYQYTQLKNSTKNLTLQNKIAKAMKSQMDYLESQTKLSKFEIEYAQKKLSILKAQIALENAQNNKTQLNLQRDSTGNYSYVYTADADEVEKAQQELEQAKNDAYEVAKNQLTTGRDNIESYLDKLNERYKDATDEERAAAIGEAGTTYLKDQWQQMLKAYQYLQEDFGVKNYAELGFLENDEILSTLVSGGSVNWTSLMDTLNTQVSESNADYKEALSNIKTIVDTVEKDVKSISDYFVGSNSSFMEDMDKRLSDDNSALISSLGELIQAVNSAEQTVSNLNEARKKEDKDSWATEVQTATKDTAAQVAKNINNAVEVAGYGMSKTSQGSGGTWGTLDEGDTAIATRALKLFKGKKLQKQADTSIKKGDRVTVQQISEEGGWAKVNVNGGSKSFYAKLWALKKYLASYDTGGYTGSWSKGDGLDSKNGRLALLHQKEIVLNSDDTSNLLTAVKLVREMKDSIQNITDFSDYSKAAFADTSEKVIEQRVEITASFPSAKDADDIRSALLSIADKAYQYSN